MQSRTAGTLQKVIFIVFSPSLHCRPTDTLYLIEKWNNNVPNGHVFAIFRLADKRAIARHPRANGTYGSSRRISREKYVTLSFLKKRTPY